jgi:hypothetical protein
MIAILTLLMLASPPQDASPTTVPRGMERRNRPGVGPAVDEAERARRLEQRRLFRPPSIFGDRPPVRGWRPAYTINSAGIADQAIPFPFQFNLPNPAPGLVWLRSYNSAVLYDPLGNIVIEVRPRWFGP